MRFVYIALVSISFLTLNEVVGEQPPPLFSNRFVVYAREKESTSPDLLLAWPPGSSVDSLNLSLNDDDFVENVPTPLSVASPTPVLPTATATPNPTLALSTSRLQPSVALNPSYNEASLLPLAGLAMYYNPEVMQEVVLNRLAMGDVSVCNECIGQVALLRVGDLNRRVWLQWEDGKIEGPFLVADVAAPQHVAYLLARNWVVDVDYRTALRKGMTAPVPVTVLAGPSTTAPQLAISGTPATMLISSDTPATATALPFPYATSPQPNPSATPTSIQAIQVVTVKTAQPSPVPIGTTIQTTFEMTGTPTAFPYPYGTSQPAFAATETAPSTPSAQ